MAIKKFYVSRELPGYSFDKKKRQYFSWGYDIYLDGVRVQERGFSNKELAQNAAAKKKLEVKESLHGFIKPVKSPYLIELMQKKLNSLPEKSAERSRAKRVFSDFLKLLPKDLKVIDLRTAHIQEYITSRLSSGVSGATVRRELVPVMAMLNNAHIFYAALDNYRAPRKPKIKISKQRKERVISHSERQKLFEYFFAPKKKDENTQQLDSRRRCGQFLQTLLLTVSRPGEIAKLKRDAIDLENKTVKISGTKTKYVSENLTRTIRITPTLEKIFSERIETSKRNKKGFIFTRGGNVTQKMYWQLRRACKACGIPYGKSAGITFHTARHTAITDLITSNLIDLKTAGRLAGHSDENMTMYYTHVSNKNLDAAAEILEKNNRF